MSYILMPSSTLRRRLIRRLAASSPSTFDTNENARFAALVPTGYFRYLTENTVKDELSAPLESANVEPEEARYRIRTYAQVLRIDHLLERNPLTLSGGELQRLAIGTGLVRQPKLLLLEEPFAELDDSSIRLLDELLSSDLPSLGVATCSVGSIVTRALKRSHSVWAQFGDDLLPLPLDGGSTLKGLTSDPCGYAIDAAAHHHEARTIAPTSPTLPAIVEFRNTSFRYPRQRRIAINGVSASFNAGQRVALTGPNGSGKSTLLTLALGFESCGSSLRLYGQARSRKGVDRLRAHLGVLFQANHQHFFFDTVAEELESAFAFRHAARDSQAWPYPASSVEQTASRFSLESVLNQSVDTLLGSHRRLLGVATALLTARDLVVLDEPTAGLDRRGRSAIERELHRLDRLHALAVVISHDRGFLEEVCDYEINLSAGQIAFAGPFRKDDDLTNS